MPRLLQIITQLEYGGAQLSTIHLANHFSELPGWESTIAAGPGGYLDYQPGRFMKNVVRTRVQNLVRNISPVKDIQGYFEIRRLIKQFQPDIVHTHSSKAGIIGRYAAHQAGIKHIFHTIHGFGFSDYHPHWKKILFIHLERLAARRTTVLIPVTPQDTIKGLNNKIGTQNQYRLIRSGIDLDIITPIFTSKRKEQQNSGRRVMGTVSCMKPQKDLITFVRIAKKVKEKYPDMNFMIIGDGVERVAIEQEIETAGLKECFQLPGWKDNIQEVVCGWSVFVLTSLWEGLPKAVLESMCIGVPVVATSVDGTCEIIEDGLNGKLFTPGDYTTGAKKVCEILGDSEQRDKLISAARDTVTEEYSLSKMASDHEKLYNEFL